MKLKDQLHKQLKNLSKADLHMHSNFSDGKPSIEQILDYVEKKTDLDVIAITDHDTVDGAIHARELMEKKKYRFELIVGEEVSSNEGHIVGLFLKETINPLQPAHEVIKEIHEQGGIAIMAHPFYHTRFNSNKIYAAKSVGAAILINEKNNYDAIETVNGVPTYGEVNLRAQYINRLLLFKPETGGSDAHILNSIGKGYTVFEGNTSHDLRLAILEEQTQAMNAKWDIAGLLRYVFFLWPRGLRLLFRTIILGPLKRQKEIINFPSKSKLKKEMFDAD